MWAKHCKLANRSHFAMPNLTFRSTQALRGCALASSWPSTTLLDARSTSYRYGKISVQAPKPDMARSVSGRERQPHFQQIKPMHIRYTLLPIFLLATLSNAIAKESCGIHAAGLLASSKTKELATLFANPSEVLGPLQRMAESLGKVTGIQEATTARFAQHTRISIQAKDLPDSYTYQGYWINAHSESIGPLQFHIASAPESDCRLLALHVDTAK